MSDRSKNADSQTYYTNDEKVKILLGLVIIYNVAVENQITLIKDFKNYKSWPNVISRVLAMSSNAICGNIG